MTAAGIARTRIRVKEWKRASAPSGSNGAGSSGADVAPARVAAGSNLAGSSIMGGYEGSQRNRRLFPFRPSEAGVNSLLVLAGGTLRARARHLVRNNPYAKKARRVFVSKLVSTGFGLIPLIKDKPLRDQVKDLWAISCEEMDGYGKTDFTGQLAQVAGQIFDAGEIFGQFIERPSSYGLAVPLQIKLRESEFCPYELNLVSGSGNPIRAGIEFDKADTDKPAKYWFWRRHPGEIAMPDIELGYEQIPAEDVVHCFEPLRPGQIRGVSWLAAGIVRAFFIDQYEDAELARKGTAALFAGFIKKTADDDQSPLGAQDQPLAGDSSGSMNAAGEVIAGLSPGMLQVLFPGEDITFSQPADSGPNFEAFMYRALLALCAAMDMPYFAVTGDLKQANYSSLRMGLVDLKESIEMLRRTVLVFQFCRTVYRRWFKTAVLTGALPISAASYLATPSSFSRARWQPPRWTWVDPLKEVEAEIKGTRAGFTSDEHVIASHGEDIEEVYAAIARGNELADRYGLVRDSDPRRTNLRGSNPPPDAAAPAEAPGAEKEAADEAVDPDSQSQEEAA